MSAVDVRVHRREAVCETFADETLRSKVIALVELVLTDDMEDAGVALEARRMKHPVVQKMFDASQAKIRRFERDVPDESVHLVPEAEEMFGQVAAVLAG